MDIDMPVAAFDLWILALVTRPSLRPLGFFQHHATENDTGDSLKNAIPDFIWSRRTLIWSQLDELGKVKLELVAQLPTPVAPDALSSNRRWVPFPSTEVAYCAPLNDKKLATVCDLPQYDSSKAFVFALFGKAAPDNAQTAKAAWMLGLPSALLKTLQAPSTGAKVENMRAAQNVDCPEAIYNGRPANLTGPPISVYHPIFGVFQSMIARDLKTFPFERQDLQVTQALINAASQYYVNEKERQDQIASFLDYFFGVGFSTTKELRSGAKTYKPDSSKRCPMDALYDAWEAGHGEALSLIRELTNGVGIGSCDPMDQGEKDYLFSCLNPNLAKLRKFSPMPAFLMVDAGPHLAVCGLIFAGRVVAQQLTPYIPLVPLLPHLSVAPEDQITSGNDLHVAQVARLLRSLATCVCSLDEYYRTISSPPNDDSLRPAPHFDSFTTAGKTYHLSYIRRIADHAEASHRAIFLANATSTDPESRILCVVKFTSSYGKKVHLFMQQLRAAPRLLYCSQERSIGNHFACVIEYVEPSEVGFTAAGFTLLRKALTSLHEHHMVFGDLRLPNILFTQAGIPLLIDFDWSGDEGTVRYPIALNKGLSWPAGVVAGGLIKSTHDVAMLDQLELLFKRV
ncbi:hypothetical protein B0H12DRAFT_1234949 [Mycena haematopus]|nr:hypothetical protein B0H12DRAFT_1234949 [Mycena haematopus]